MILATRGLTKRFGSRTAVRELSLTVERGDVYGFLGPNGAGKTTTMRMLVGLVRPTAGEISLLGEGLTARRRGALARVGAIIETPAFYGYLTGRDNLRMMADLTGRCPAGRIDEVLDRVGLLDRADDRAGIYSHGMKQRLAIAAALLPRPELVMLDEPTNGLDPMGIRDMRALVRSLARDDGLTVFLSSHLLVEIEQICNRGAILVDGARVWEGRVAELLAERRRLRLRATPLERVREVLAAADIAATADPADATLLHLRPGAQPGDREADGDSSAAADVVARLVGAGCRVHEIAAENPTLEEVFVELVTRNGGSRGAA